MKKWILTALAVGLGVGYCTPRLQSEYDKLVKIADMQAVKIAIVEQASKLETYSRQIQESQRRKEIARRELRDKLRAAQIPLVNPDPKDVNGNN